MSVVRTVFFNDKEIIIFHIYIAHFLYRIIKCTLQEGLNGGVHMSVI